MSQRYLGGIITANPTTPTMTTESGVWTLEQQFQYSNVWSPKIVGNSVRLRQSASAYFNRTPASTGNRQIMTFSFWMKRGLLTYSGGYLQLFTAYPGTSAIDLIAFSPSSDSLRVWFNGSSSADLITTQVFRDPSAWYHIVVAIDTTQATSSNRIKVYVNGSQVTSFSTSTYPSQNYSTYWNSSSYASAIGANLNGPQGYFDGYLAEVNFIDGQALTPSSFGAFDTNGIWQPLPYTGTYGTNGFYLTFADNSGATATTIGKDYSGNGNNWTPNNISVTSGVTYDWMLDTPTNSDNGGNGRGNYATWNPLDKRTSGASTFANGNLAATVGASGSTEEASATITFPSSGSWYCEITCSNVASGNARIGIGNSATAIDSRPASGYLYQQDGQKYVLGSASAYGSSYTTGNVIGIAFDASAGSITFYKDNTSQGAITGISTSSIWVITATGKATVWTANFGQRPFAYTPPTGFLALNTQNLPAVTINNGAQYMAATLYTGNGSSQTITGVGFQPDLLWIKERSSTSSHCIWNSVVGVSKYLSSNTTSAEYTTTTELSSINSDGFSVGSSGATNESSQTYVAWQWKAGGTAVSNTNGSITSQVSANTTAGFSVVTYTTNNTAGATIGHGLGVAPSMVICRSISTAASWAVYHASLGGTKWLRLNSTGGTTTSSQEWNNTNPSSTVVTLGGAGSNVNDGVGNSGLAYCWAEVAGYSKFGSYTGNGSTDGPFVYCGFRPRYVMVKRTDSTSDWNIWDTSRSPYNQGGQTLWANLSNAEYTAGVYYDVLSNGFKLKDGNAEANASGGTYIYAAFAENPFNISRAR